MRTLFILIAKLVVSIRQWYFKIQLNRLKEIAYKEHRITNRRFIILRYKGRPVLFTKGRIKEMIAAKKFPKGVTIQDIEKQAIQIIPHHEIFN